jgi:predicted metal-dependent hydrolase
MQKSQNILYYTGIGDVSFVRSHRARNLSIRINQQGEVRVTMPSFVSQKRAERFLHSKQEWVLKRLNGLNHMNCRGTLPPEGGAIQIRGRDYVVHLLRGDADVEAAIWRVLQKEALHYLPGRVTELSEKHGYKISGLKIRRMKTRWGSCTARKSINLNSWLVMLPEYLSDYVILHELVHTRIPDHSIRFWEELDGITGGLSMEYRRELRKRQIMCFPQGLPDQ